MFEILIQTFGMLSVIRSLEHIRQKSLITADELPKIGTLVVVIGVLIAASSFFFPVYATFVFCGYVLLSRHLIWFIRRWRLRAFEQQKILILNHLLLKMKTGQSLRSAFLAIVRESESLGSHIGSLLRQIHQTLELGKLSSSLISLPAVDEMARELLNADQSSHHSLVRVQNLRSLFKKRSDFRRRSGQVLTQIRAQALILSVLYFALFVFTSVQYGWQRFVELRVISALFFVMGVLMIFYLGRKVRWKV